MLQPGDEEVRGALTRAIARLGYAPPAAALGEELGQSAGEIEAALHRLHAAHSLQLHPNSARPWVVHPFALAPGSCWVATAGGKGYWANCLYCALGIAACCGDAEITTRYGGEGETRVFRVQSGELLDTEGVFHLSTPVAQWWDNVIFACSSFQPFKNEADVEAWCSRHDLPRGATMTLPQLWKFAGEWYGSYLKEPWRKRKTQDIRALFARHGLEGPFWSVG